MFLKHSSHESRWDCCILDKVTSWYSIRKIHSLMANFGLAAYYLWVLMEVNLHSLLTNNGNQKQERTTFGLITFSWRQMGISGKCFSELNMICLLWLMFEIYCFPLQNLSMHLENYIISALQVSCHNYITRVYSILYANANTVLHVWLLVFRADVVWTASYCTIHF